MVWARHLGLLVDVTDVGRGWLFIKKAGRGYSLWIQPQTSPYTDNSAPRYLCYVPKRLAEEIINSDPERARMLALELLWRKNHPVGVVREKPVIREDVKMMKLGYAYALGYYGRIILYKRRRGDWALYLNEPNRRGWRYMVYVPVEYVNRLLEEPNIERATREAVKMIEGWRKPAEEKYTYINYVQKPTEEQSVEDDIGEWMLERLEWGDIESIREYLDYNPNNAYELGYTKEDLIKLGIFTRKEIEESEKY